MDENKEEEEANVIIAAVLRVGDAADSSRSRTKK